MQTRWSVSVFPLKVNDVGKQANYYSANKKNPKVYFQLEYLFQFQEIKLQIWLF